MARRSLAPPLPPDDHTTPIVAFSGRYRFLSNFYAVEIQHRLRWADDDFVDWVFRSVEHAYQASKAQDVHQAVRIRRMTTPADARRVGKSIALRPDWDQMRIPVMRELVRVKFGTHPALAEALCASGDRELVEGNTWGDRFWGATVPIRLAEPLTTTLPIWKSAADGILVGENWLGKILMERRAVLRREQPAFDRRKFARGSER